MFMPTNKWESDVPGVLVTLIPGILRGSAISFITFTEYRQNVHKYSTPIQMKTSIFCLSFTH